LKLYSIELQNGRVTWKHWPVDKLPWLTARVAMGGTGGLHLVKHKKKKEWVRDVLRTIRAYDRGKVSALVVADQLASLNYEVHKDINDAKKLGITDKSVGPRCIVAWRNKKGGAHKGGGGHQAYAGTTRADVPLIPTIGTGMAVHEIIGAMMPHMAKMFEAVRAGRPAKEPEWADDFARLSDKPDEHLR
jgi:hypothetical protein